MLFGPIPKFASAISGMSPTKVSEKNEKTAIVTRIRRISGSAAAILNPDRKRVRPVSASSRLTRAGYLATRRLAMAKT